MFCTFQTLKNMLTKFSDDLLTCTIQTNDATPKKSFALEYF